MSAPLRLRLDEDGCATVDGWITVAGQASRTVHLAPEDAYQATSSVLCGAVSHVGIGPRIQPLYRYGRPPVLCRRCRKLAEVQP